MDSTHHERPAGVPLFFQVSEHLVRVLSAQARDVLKETPRRSCFPDDSEQLGPEPSVVGFSFSLSGEGDRLTGEPPGDDIDPSKPKSRNIMDILVDRHIGPVFLQHPAAKFLFFAESHGAKAPCGLQPEGKPPDAGEEVQNPHLPGYVLNCGWLPTSLQ